MVRYSWTEANWRSRLTLLLAAFALTSSKALAVSVPFALQRGVDAIVGGDKTAAAKALLYYCWARLAVTLTSEVRSLCYAAASQQATRRYARKLFDAMHELGSSFHARRPTGFLSVAFSRGARGFQSLLGQLLFSIGPTFIELVLSAIVLAEKFGPQIGGITLLTFALYAFYTAKVVDVKVKVRRRIVDLDNAKNAYLVDSLACHETVKVFDNRKIETQRFDHFLRRMVAAFVASTRVGSLLNVGQAVIFSSGLALALLKVAQTAPTVGDVVAVNALLLQLAQPMNFLGYTISEIRQALVDVAVTQSVLDERDAQKKATQRLITKDEDDHFLRGDDPSIDSDTAPALVFDDVTVRYETSHHGEDEKNAGVLDDDENEAPKIRRTFVALKNCSFVAEAGEVTVLAGKSGSGKSTAMRLAARLDRPGHGDVYLEYDTSKKYRAADLPWRLRKRAAFVPQEALLFDETALWNVKYGALDHETSFARGDDDLKKDDDSVRAAISLANVDVDRLPAGLESRVGERGQHVSGGQRQRLAVARALVREPRIALADEPTSGLDAVTERDVLKALVGTSKPRRTLVVVAHRLAAVAPLAHKIVVFKEGTVVQAGSHHDLLRDTQGEYFRLWTAGQGHSDDDDDDDDDDEDRRLLLPLQGGAAAAGNVRVR
mmetsp:Transcript_23884/g.73545  ORF Transcript_23884/g.73545 Transcript_23884/m.73545 type:complete len:661 (-) Transcript_23884:125-2107(-)